MIITLTGNVATMVDVTVIRGTLTMVDDPGDAPQTPHKAPARGQRLAAMHICADRGG